MEFSGRRSSEDDEAYWNKSAPKAVGLFDDDEEDKDAKAFAADGRKKLLSADDDLDSLGAYTVDIVETPTPQPADVPNSSIIPQANSHTSAPAVRYQRAGSARAFPSHVSTDPAPTVEAWRGSSLKGITKPLMPNLEHERKVPDIAEEVAKTVREPTRADVAKLETKIKRLQIQLETHSLGTLPVEETIKRMLCGKPYILESYKSLKDKKALLSSALAKHDGNTINAVILFLKQTLNQSLFQSTLLEVGGAEQYVSYLKQTDGVEEAEDIVSMIGKSEDAAMTRYRFAIQPTSVDQKINRLKSCQMSQFELNPVLATDCQHISNQISLLQVQQIIERADAEMEAQGKHHIMRTHKRRGTLPNQPLLTTLYYCCLYHYDQSHTQFSSPHYLIDKFKMTDTQLQWMATAALSRIHRWSQLEQLFAGKNWYGGSKVISTIGFGNVVKILHKNKATPDIINKYCSRISNEEERLSVAMKYGCHMTAVETLIAMKDKSGLMELMRSLSYGSTERLKADAALKSSIKWRN
ncbi:spermatogenesis-defective protein 39 homolog [Watersipora subatra]|uniref:spermatogenesis-defective protein 39 homolog n=1 Tax=Watersipora subatra TaxID=2589382 RepID=UPI00355BE2A7